MQITWRFAVLILALTAFTGIAFGKSSSSVTVSSSANLVANSRHLSNDRTQRLLFHSSALTPVLAFVGSN
jgi:parvulin-like peptidyl-prolyl isomerase